MKRSLVLAVAVCTIAGCRGPAANVADPFVGRTKIPPPRTGTICAGSDDPSYRGTPAPVTPLKPIPQTAPGGSTAPANSGRLEGYPPANGGFKPHGASASAARTSQSTRMATRVGSPPLENRPPARVSPDPSVPAGHERVIRILPPRRKADANSNPASKSSDGRSLPDSSQVWAASATEVPGDSGNVKAAVASASTTGLKPNARYGYEPDYGRLRGKLEYSEIDRHWKLRYIPVDGTTDQFGGSVILPELKVSGFERDDFLEVRGRIGKKPPKKGFAPSYEAAEIKRLDKSGS